MEHESDARDPESARSAVTAAETPDELLLDLPRFPTHRQPGASLSPTPMTSDGESNLGQSPSSHRASLQDPSSSQEQQNPFRPQQSLRLSPASASPPTLPRRRTTTSSSVTSTNTSQHNGVDHTGRRVSARTLQQRVAYGIRQFTGGAVDDPASEDWSVFGEVMGPHDGSSTTTTTATTTTMAPGGSRGQRVDGTATGIVVHPVPVPRASGGSNELLYSGHRAYSPVSIRYHDDRAFPALMEGVEDLPIGPQNDTGLSSEDGHGAESDTELTSASHKDDDVVREVQQGDDDDQQLLYGGGGVSRAGRARRGLLSRLPTLSTLHRNILKCSIAYFLGSLFTYYSPLARFLADLAQDGPGEPYLTATGHMVATV
jgi:hypothetical protein